MNLVSLMCAWLLGSALAAWLDPDLAVIGLVALCPMAGVALWWRQPHLRNRFALALMALLGMWRYVTWQPVVDSGHVAHYNGTGRVTLVGVVAADPDMRDTSTQLRVKAERLVIGGQERQVRGTVLVQAPRYPYRSYGEQIQAIGTLRTPPDDGGFSYRDYLARQGILSLMSYPEMTTLEQGRASPLFGALYALRARARAIIAAMLPEPEASLLTGILLGIQSGIPQPVMDAFLATGTIHIIVISGFNLSLLAGLSLRVGTRIWHRYHAIILSMIFVIAYTLLVGATAPVVRASIMASLAMLAYLVGRPYQVSTALAGAVLIMTVINPTAPWDVSFQLSVAATAGLLILPPLLFQPLEARLTALSTGSGADRMLHLAAEIFLATCAAQLATLPIILYHFGRLSLISLLTNMLILPIQPLIMSWGGIATLLGFVSLPVGRIVAWVSWLLLAYTTRVVEWTARPGWATVDLPMRGWFVLVCYGLLFGLPWALRHKRGRARSGSKAMVPPQAQPSPAHPRTLPLILMLGMACALIWMAVISLPDGRLQVHFFNVGQGDAIFITLPDGQQILVDGGPEPSRLLDQLGRVMPFWDRTLDILVLTHADMDHLGGLLAVLERYHVGHVLYPARLRQSAPTDYWHEILASSAANLLIAEAGMAFSWGDYARIEVLHPGPEPVPGKPDDANNNSVVLRLDYGETSFLLTGDIEAEAEGYLLQQGRLFPCQVLKVSHHGAAQSTTAAFLRATRPAVAIISVGAGNRYGHPAKATLDRLGEQGAQILRTDEQGTIRVRSDGQRLWVQGQWP